MLTALIPDDRGPERRYVLDVLLGDLLGQTYRARTAPSTGQIILEADGRRLILRDGLFGTSADAWLKPESLPRTPLRHWTPALPEADLIAPTLPVLYGAPLPSGQMMALGTEEIEVGADLLGNSFFMLTRYEEVAERVEDQHRRYPGQASLAARADFLQRPIVHEWAEVLWACMKRLWPTLERPQRQGRTLISHDVDHPWRYRFGPWRVARSIKTDLRAALPDPKAALGVLRNVAAARRGDFGKDPYYTFDWIMDLAEQRGQPHTFYVFGGRSDPRFDAKYDTGHPWTRRLLRDLHRRGHHIGLHTSFHTFLDGHRAAAELANLKAVCAQEGIEQERWGVRQHYLRWRSPVTWRHLDKAGADFDATMGFADRAGFRTGACVEHAVFDLRQRRTLSIRERPLVAMECSIIDPCYMGLGVDDGRAWECFATLRQRCHRYGGDFTLLWHNSRMQDPRERALFERLCLEDQEG